MNAGSGEAVIKIEPAKDAELRIALAIERANNCLLHHTVAHQAETIGQLNRLITRLNSRSSN